MKKWKTEEWQVKMVFYGLLVMFLMAILPLFAMSFYSFMSADDYAFAKNPVAVWKE